MLGWWDFVPVSSVKAVSQIQQTCNTLEEFIDVMIIWRCSKIKVFGQF